MIRKARIGMTKDFFDKNKNPIYDSPALKKILRGTSNSECVVFSESLPEITPEQIRGFDMVITRTSPRWNRSSLVGNDQLLAVLRYGVGYDKIDVPALTDAAVMLSITPAAVRRPVATAIMAFVLALATKIVEKDKMTRSGEWHTVAQNRGYGLTDKVLGSIGVGNIGQEMFRLAEPFGMKHIAYDPYVPPEKVVDIGVKLVDIDTVLAKSDFLNISCMLNEETRHLVGEKELRKMKKTAFLINTARGPIVDEAALIKALQQRWIQGAGIDVFEQEPTRPDNPLFQLDNVIVTAHAMAQIDESTTTIWQHVLEHILEVIRGEMRGGVVNPEVWEKKEFQTKLRKLLASIA